ncbi:DNA primase/polymerase [Streptomyces phage Bing]|uniref:DNA primase/polymerase n=1 Tax=Streptomyces phage Bing TaxID=2079427 RepID=A0A2L1IWD9_9CAUD|nr:DNA polymerase [Streptomyces phage Bing]AVD99486.1 DNA primase/polymerase [Streptomyces phage Bing]
MDFFQVCTKEARGKSGTVEVFPDFIVGRSKDLMIRGREFYAVWNKELGLWSTETYDVKNIVDEAVMAEAEKLKAAGVPCNVKLLRSHNSKAWADYKKYLKDASDSFHPLDMKVTFANTEVKRNDYVSKRLPYSLAAGEITAYEELLDTLYSPEEREKIEWAIGAIIAGDAKKIEKFIVFYGPGGTGKSTVMKIIQKLFGGLVPDGGYVETFEAKALVGNGHAFALEAFKNNPLVAINHDGDLSKIDDNSRLNSIVSHEDMTVNEKFKSQYTMRINAFLFMGTNKPVKISDAKSGLIRRVIDVVPTGVTFEAGHYYALMDRVDFELGAIAQHCLSVYKRLGRSYYNGYIPERMMAKTNVFYNFVEEHFDIFKGQDYTTLSHAWKLYKTYAEHAELGYKMKHPDFREELKNYFEEFHERKMIGGKQERSVYMGFSMKRFRTSSIPETSGEPKTYSLLMEETESILDEMYAGLTAQYANAEGNPKLYWDDSERIHPKTGEPFIPKPSQVVSTVLGDLDTTKLHFLQVPENHIVIDFDLTDEDGKKSREKNLEAASAWPPTYGEFSKSGNGVHLHYFYDGDVNDLAAVYSEGIEIKVYSGNSSLRRKLSYCNNVAVATINSGLPFKEKKTMLTTNKLRSEQGLRNMITRALNKEFPPHSTKSSVDFIKKLMDDAYQAGYPYDVSDMRQKILLFAMQSKNQPEICLKTVAKMQFQSSEEAMEAIGTADVTAADERLVFFDCEVYPNLFVICWKYDGSPTMVEMINPTPQEVEQLFRYKLVGYNNRPYDNHIMWARMMGANNEQLYKLSKKIIEEKDNNALFGEAWSASYADVYDFAAVKQSLKKWEIDLNIPHVEMDIPWDQPVPDEKIKDVVKYCGNDVNALEVVFHHLKQDFIARQILADLSGLTVNHSTRQHVMRILFGNERNPQGSFVYTDLSEMFPGYEFNEYAKIDKSTYRGVSVGEGGFVYAEPGIHENVALLDVASMHPTSIQELNLFGPYTPKFSAIMEARLSIKDGDFDYAKKLLEGRLEPHIEAIEQEATQAHMDGKYESVEKAKKALSKPLADAMKLVINSTYGYTAAKFPNPARDPRNKDNIVAKRGALFMVDLLHAVQEQGFTVAHIKTDSIKIPNATPEIIDFVMKFGEKYGYSFKHEATYSKMCLVNDAVYVAYKSYDADGKTGWTATGAEFKHPYVFKTMFTHEPIRFQDLCETKQVRNGGAMYLRYTHADGTVEDHHVGRSGSFLPVKNEGHERLTGRELLVIKGEGEAQKVSAVQGTKGYLWVESEMVREIYGDVLDRMTFERLEDAVEGTGSLVDFVDMAYFANVVEDAAQSIAEFARNEEDPEDTRMTYEEFVA